MKNNAMYQIKSLHHEIVRYMMNNKCKDKNNIPTMVQMQIIYYMKMHENENIYQKDLEKALNIRRATISEVLKTMEKNNIISRTVNENDTRVKKIALNQKAHIIFDNMKHVFKETEKILEKNIVSSDLKNFYKVLFKMKENLKEEGMKNVKTN